MEQYIYLAIAACVCAFLIALARHTGLLRRIALSCGGGLAALGAVNLSGLLTGVSLGLNVWTFGVSAVLGVPGVVMMLFLKWMWRI